MTLSKALTIDGEKELFAKLNQIAADVAGRVKREALEAGAKIVKESAQARAPKSIAKGILVEIDKDTAIIGPDKKLFYSIFVEYGTKRHRVKVKRKKVLTDQRKFFGKEVRHPGAPARPFLHPALDENEEEIKQAMAKAIARGLGIR